MILYDMILYHTEGTVQYDMISYEYLRYDRRLLSLSTEGRKISLALPPGPWLALIPLAILSRVSV